MTTFRFRTVRNRLGTIWYGPRTFTIQIDTLMAIKENSVTLDHARKIEELDEPSVIADINACRDLLVGSSVQEIGRPQLASGQYHPRVWRQFSGPHASHYGRDFTDAAVAFQILEEETESIFRVVEPDPTTHSAVYGHKIRELLILACTEVENLFKRVMAENGYLNPDKTTDYVKTLPVLMLDQWEVAFLSYPNYPRLKPFHGWDPRAPSQTLYWYEAYNDTKHNRHVNFSAATLERALESVAAVFVLMAAQFGVGITRNPFSVWEPAFRLLRVTQFPDFPLVSQYIPAKTWTKTNFTF